MAMCCLDLEVILKIRREGHLKTPGSVIEIGAQQLSNDFFNEDHLREAARLFEVDPSFVGNIGEPAGTGIELPDDAPSAKPFWEALGLTYASIDIDGTPYAIPLDLNYDGVPESSKGKFSLVTNFGTTEHVANQLNAFKIIHDLAEPGGIMVHNLPVQGQPNHGLVNYNLKFFWLLARSNEYEWLHLDYRGSDDSRYGLREDIVQDVSRFSPDFVERSRTITVGDHGVVVALRKVRDVDYVAPIDVAADKCPNEVMAQRYWTVFRPDHPPVRPPLPRWERWWDYSPIKGTGLMTRLRQWRSPRVP